MSQLDLERITERLSSRLAYRGYLLFEEVETMELVAELTKEREANQKMVEALNWYANPYNYSTEHLNKHGYILIDNDNGEQAREALGKSKADYETAGECAWCGEIRSELKHSHMFDHDPNGGKICRICWDHDREVYKGSYGEDIGPFDQKAIEEGNEPNG